MNYFDIVSLMNKRCKPFCIECSLFQEPKVNFSAEHKNSQSLAARQLSGQFLSGEHRSRDPTNHLGKPSRDSSGKQRDSSSEGKGKESPSLAGRLGASTATSAEKKGSAFSSKSDTESKRSGNL